VTPVSRILLSLSLALLGGCATLGKNECLHANWYAVGLEDGAQGRALERLGEHRRACAEHGVMPDAERYVAGRSEGLGSFCTYERGYAHGRAGHGYTGACPAQLAVNFLAGYGRGRELHDLTTRLQAAQGQVSRSKAALREGIRDPAARAKEVERLEQSSREAEQLEEALARVK
jgi:hypothetical protein